MRGRITIGAWAILAAMLAGAVEAKRDIYAQDPGFRGVEYGNPPNDDMQLVDDSRAPVRIYRRQPPVVKMGYARVQPARYYYHAEHGFYRCVFEFDVSQNEGVKEALTREFGDPSQTMPLGGREVVVWLRSETLVEFTMNQQGKSKVVVSSQKIAPRVGG